MRTNTAIARWSTLWSLCVVMTLGLILSLHPASVHAAGSGTKLTLASIAKFYSTHKPLPRHKPVHASISSSPYTAPSGYTVSQLADTGDPNLTTMTIDQATGNIYLGASDAVFQLTMSGSVTNLGYLYFPYVVTGLQYYSGQLYLANGFDDSIDAFDVTSGNTTNITWFPGFDEAGVANVGNVLYFTSGVEVDPGSLYSLNLSDTTNTLNTVSSTLPAGSTTLKYDPVHQVAYLAADGGYFYSVNLATGSATALQPLPDGPFDTYGSDGSGIGHFAVDPTGSYLFYRVPFDGGGSTDTIKRYEIATGIVTSFVTGLNGGNGNGGGLGGDLTTCLSVPRRRAPASASISPMAARCRKSAGSARPPRWPTSPIPAITGSGLLDIRRPGQCDFRRCRAVPDGLRPGRQRVRGRHGEQFR